MKSFTVLSNNRKNDQLQLQLSLITPFQRRNSETEFSGTKISSLNSLYSHRSLGREKFLPLKIWSPNYPTGTEWLERERAGAVVESSRKFSPTPTTISKIMRPKPWPSKIKKCSCSLHSLRLHKFLYFAGPWFRAHNFRNGSSGGRKLSLDKSIEWRHETPTFGAGCLQIEAWSCQLSYHGPYKFKLPIQGVTNEYRI